MTRLSTVGFAAAFVLAGTLVFTVSAQQSGTKPAPAAPKAGPVAPPTTDADKIKSAMSAAPAAISANATVMDMGTMKELKKGTNGWTCIPDMPHTPGADPMCLDANGLMWAD